MNEVKFSGVYPASELSESDRIIVDRANRELQLTEIAFVHLKSDCFFKFILEDRGITLSHKHSVRAFAFGSYVGVLVTFDVVGVPTNRIGLDGETKARMEVSLGLEITYSCDETFPWNEVVLGQYATTTSLRVAWPYLRSTVQDLSLRMGLSGIVLPLLAPYAQQAVDQMTLFDNALEADTE